MRPQKKKNRGYAERTEGNQIARSWRSSEERNLKARKKLRRRQNPILIKKTESQNLPRTKIENPKQRRDVVTRNQGEHNLQGWQRPDKATQRRVYHAKKSPHNTEEPHDSNAWSQELAAASTRKEVCVK